MVVVLGASRQPGLVRSVPARSQRPELLLQRHLVLNPLCDVAEERLGVRVQGFVRSTGHGSWREALACEGAVRVEPPGAVSAPYNLYVTFVCRICM